MFGINGLEFVILAIAAVMIIGPERLPEYAAQLARLARELRSMATGARQQLRDEVGPDFDDVDWRKLDPRQYDPRRIIKEALMDEGPPPKAQSPHGPSSATNTAAGAVGGTNTAAGAAAGNNTATGTAAGGSRAPGSTALSSSAATLNQTAGGAAMPSPAGSAPVPRRKLERLPAHQRAPFDSEAT